MAARRPQGVLPRPRTTDLKQVLESAGLIHGGGATSLDLEGGTLTAAHGTIDNGAGTSFLNVGGVLTATKGTAAPVIIRSGNASAWTALDIGRTSNEVLVGVASTGTIFAGCAAGDMAIRNLDSAKLIFVGVGTAASFTVGTSTIGLKDPIDLVLGTTTGTKIGTAISQKLGFYNATPIVQPSSTTDLRTALINLGLYASGGASPLNLNGGTLTAAVAVIGTNPADAGAVRIPNNLGINGRNTTNSANVQMILVNSSNEVSIAAGGAAVRVGGATVFDSTLAIANGTAGAPSLALANSPTTGMFRSGVDTIGWSVAGIERMTYNATALSLNTGLAMLDGKSISFGTTNGGTIATATNQKIGFYGITPIVQPAGTTDLRQALINLGLYASGGASPLNLNGGAFTTTGTAATGALIATLASGTAVAALSGNTDNWVSYAVGRTGTEGHLGISTAGVGFVGAAAGDMFIRVNDTTKSIRFGFDAAGNNERVSISNTALTIVDAVNVVLGTTTGTKWATATTQKQAWYGATPIVQPSSTTDLRTALINLGLYASGGATPLNLNGGAFSAATALLTATSTADNSVKVVTIGGQTGSAIAVRSPGDVATLFNVSATGAVLATAANAPGFTTRSGAAGSWTGLDVGRTAVEGYFGISATGAGFAEAAAGDAFIRLLDSAKIIRIGAGTTAQLLVANATVDVEVPFRLSMTTATAVSSALNSEKLTINDDTVGTFTTRSGANIGFYFLTVSGAGSLQRQAIFTADQSTLLAIHLGTDVVVGNTVLTNGTSDGVDAKVNVYPASTTTIGVKNRLGATATFHLYSINPA